jgi:hypothetical protein
MKVDKTILCGWTMYARLLIVANRALSWWSRVLPPLCSLVRRISGGAARAIRFCTPCAQCATALQLGGFLENPKYLYEYVAVVICRQNGINTLNRKGVGKYQKMVGTWTFSLFLTQPSFPRIQWQNFTG